MTDLVTDASVAAKWFLPEIHSDLALDLLYAEVGNILWKRVRRAEMTEEEALTVFQGLGNLPLVWHPPWPLMVPALEIACRTDRTVYDSLYLALAVQEKAPVVTA